MQFQLKEAGFTNIDALDASEEMLEMAKKKGVYKNLMCATVGTNILPIADSKYQCQLVEMVLLAVHLKEPTKLICSNSALIHNYSKSSYCKLVLMST